MQRVPFALQALALGLARGRLAIETRLRMERMHHRIRVEKQFQDRIEQPPDEAQQAAVRFVQRLRLECVTGIRRRWRDIWRRTGATAQLPVPLCSEMRSEKSVNPLDRCTAVGTVVTQVRACFVRLPS